MPCLITLQKRPYTADANAQRQQACQLIEALLASFQLQRPEREPEAAAHSVAENNANSDPEAQPEALAENKDNDN